MAELNPRHWFLPETPDVIGLLQAQVAVTVEGADAFVAWAGSGSVTLAELTEIEIRADRGKRELLHTLREAFVTPLEPEDLFMLSRETDWILNGIGDLVAEAEALGFGPDATLLEMATLLAAAVHEIEVAVAALAGSAQASTEAADRAIERVRELEQVYFAGIASTILLEDRAERISRRELYRRCVGISETVIDVADRTVYVVVRAS